MRAFLRSEEGRTLKKIQQDYKFEAITFTNELLQETKKEIEKNNNQRSISQNAVMAETGVNPKDASATKYTEATKLFSLNIPWEHTHLIAHAILGTKSQQENNLVVATRHANTNMMFIEARIPELAKEWKITLEVTADLIPGTHIATKIEYKISGEHLTTKDTWSLPLVFDAQTPNQPHISYNEYMKRLVLAITTKNTNQTGNAPRVNRQLVFNPSPKKN